MKDSLKPGLVLERTITVDADRTIDFMGEDCRVYATPSLVRDIEHTCRDLILTHADHGEDSVGATVSITHMAPTLMGMDVTIRAEVTELDRARIAFAVSANDGLDEICKGTHGRFVVGIDKTAERLRAKAARAAQSG